MVKIKCLGLSEGSLIKETFKRAGSLGVDLKNAKTNRQEASSLSVKLSWSRPTKDQLRTYQFWQPVHLSFDEWAVMSVLFIKFIIAQPLLLFLLF